MKIICVADLHGDLRFYDKLKSVALNEEPKAVVLAGDILPKRRNIPLPIQQSSFIYHHFISICCFFEREKIHFVFITGNDDLEIYTPWVKEIASQYKYVHCINSDIAKIGRWEFIGMNYVGDHPFALKENCRKDMDCFIFPGLMYGNQAYKYNVDSTRRYFTDKEWQYYCSHLWTIERELNELPEPQDPKKAVYVIHAPPNEIRLSITRTMVDVGSQAVHNFLLKNSPLISLHGHIHESPEVTGIGKTSWTTGPYALILEERKNI